MLTNTFIHIPYVSENTEKKLWQNSINCWDDFLKIQPHVKNQDVITKFLKLSKEHYNKKNHEFFSNKIISKHQWRAYEDFKDNCCFLDIETTGLSKHRDELTVVGLYDGKKSKVYIKGKNMNEFAKDIAKFSFIVTFNGATFDLPFLKAKFPDVEFNHLHADLRFVLRRLGYAGGLKSIEKEFGIARQSDLSNLSGRDAIRLWYAYKKKGDEKALDKLIRYNIEDIENLKVLMDHSYTELKKKCLNFC
ncbi:exonuclease [archaeon]|jgi:uncharacterized protein|nr:exonuclease [archaeon]MBT4022637.1 exonuclease [archaeon]MBT4272077.1 exonuclease [archaeon]MBT4461174.1 exonuclease [archaeon]MBT4858697.1 exonuclease [archaeon]